MTWQRPPLKILPLPSSFERPSGCFWRPNKDFVEQLADELHGKRVLEVFAGNGLMAGMLAAWGVEVTATSILSHMDAHEQGIYYPIIELDAIEAVKRFHDHDVLLMCWPTTVQASYVAARLWSDIKEDEGVKAPIAYVGEFTDYTKGHLGGCAIDQFFEEFVPTKVFSAYAGNMLEKACIGEMTPKPKPNPVPAQTGRKRSP